MKYIKIFEEFVTTLNKKKSSHIIDIHNLDFFEEEEEVDKGSSIDSKGIIYIKNWTIY